MARVITVRHADYCRECQGTISAGERINYGGPGAVTHADCAPMDAPRRTGRRYQGSKYAYTSTGTRMTMSSRRCEDAPCCGCCD